MLTALLIVPAISGMEGAFKKARTSSVEVVGSHPSLNNHLICIQNLDVDGLSDLFESHGIRALTNDQKNYLYRLAKENESQIASMCSFYRASNGLGRITDLQTPFGEQLKKAKQVSTLLYAATFFPEFKFPQPFFGPQPKKNDLRPSLDKILEALIMNEKSKISVCCFHLTLYNVAKCLIEQKKQGVKVALVTNRQQGESAPLQGLSHLLDNGVKVYAPCSDKFETNHHKFVIFSSNLFNKPLLWTGSYNPTGHSNENSWEDVIIIDDEEAVFAYYDRFQEIKDASRKLELPQLQENLKKQPSHYSLRNNNVPNNLW
ncbi:MAG: phospholipase D-like domain-containing protein [Rickettsiaceae bacterium]|nr:phospholipase D-like domain-containing protein [Rickettsiaceae bacterium]